jgi:hypothetical protein
MSSGIAVAGTSYEFLGDVLTATLSDSDSSAGFGEVKKNPPV